MLNKVSGLARALYIVLAVVAGFVALGTMNIALVLVVLGLIAGISLPMDRMVAAGVTVLALPILGVVLTNIPAIGEKLAAVMGYLQIGMAASFAMAMVIILYGLVMDGVTGLMTDEAPAAGKKAAAAR